MILPPFSNCKDFFRGRFSFGQPNLHTGLQRRKTRTAVTCVLKTRAKTSKMKCRLVATSLLQMVQSSLFAWRGLRAQVPSLNLLQYLGFFRLECSSSVTVIVMSRPVFEDRLPKNLLIGGGQSQSQESFTWTVRDLSRQPVACVHGTERTKSCDHRSCHRRASKIRNTEARRPPREHYVAIKSLRFEQNMRMSQNIVKERLFAVRVVKLASP
jgi:hypothetical protein